MSELIENSSQRKKLLKHMILQLHNGEAPEEVKVRLQQFLGTVPYNEVVEVEQELISEGLPEEEVIKLCDIHGKALQGVIDHSGMKKIPSGHPVDQFKKENIALEQLAEKIHELYAQISARDKHSDIENFRLEMLGHFNQLMDVGKHYSRKENLLFPFLEKYGVTGPSKVMWAKHDEARQLLKAAQETLMQKDIIKEEPENLIDLILRPATSAVIEMIMKEEEILLPMSLDKLSDQDWYNIHLQTPEIGYCLVEPDSEWKPEGFINPEDREKIADGIIQLPTGSLKIEELISILNTLPVDLTFVDSNDKVKYFSGGKERIFTRSKAILQRDVRLCHPPASVHIVEKIISDFRNGIQDRAPFWIQMKDRFIHIEYFALRDTDGKYLGTLEVSQDLSEKRALQGEQRLLQYRNQQKY